MITILMADDDHEDCLLMEHAMRQAAPDVCVGFVHDGVSLLDFLRTHVPAGGEKKALPRLLLLDINMPRLDGIQALAEIKADPSLRGLPVVMFTSSCADTDVEQSYQLGASAFITKPMSFDGLADSFRMLSQFYLRVASLPA